MLLRRHHQQGLVWQYRAAGIPSPFCICWQIGRGRAGLILG